MVNLSAYRNTKDAQRRREDTAIKGLRATFANLLKTTTESITKIFISNIIMDEAVNLRERIEQK